MVSAALPWAAPLGYVAGSVSITAAIDWNASSYEAVCRAHRWQIPARFNIAAIACDRPNENGVVAFLLALGQLAVRGVPVCL